VVAKFEIYKNKFGEFHWRPTHLNGKIIADMEQICNTKVNQVKGIWAH
jgi:uncharacterized protein YegP (UPF0339 family)